MNLIRRENRVFVISKYCHSHESVGGASHDLVEIEEVGNQFGKNEVKYCFKS